MTDIKKSRAGKGNVIRTFRSKCKFGKNKKTGKCLTQPRKK